MISEPEKPDGKAKHIVAMRESNVRSGAEIRLREAKARAPSLLVLDE